MLDQPLAKAGAGLGRGQRRGVALVAPQTLVERLGLSQHRFECLTPAAADDIVRILAGGQFDEAQGALGSDVGQSAQRGADRGFAPGAVAVEAQDRRGIEPPHPLELAFGDRGAVGRDGFGDPRPVEGDDVHVTLDDNQALGGAAGGRGAVDVVQRAALVEQRRVGGVEVFGLAVAEDRPPKAMTRPRGSGRNVPPRKRSSFLRRPRFVSMPVSMFSRRRG